MRRPMGKTVKLTFLPEGIDSTIDRIRQLGEKTEEAMKEASRATRGLGMAGADLRDNIEGCKDAIARHEQELAKLAPAYVTAAKEAQELEARLEALQERRDQIAPLKGEGTYGIELEEINEEISSTCDKLDEYDDVLNENRAAMRRQSDAIREVVADMRGYEEEALAARQATLEDAKARREAAQEAKRQREAMRAVREAAREEKAAIRESVNGLTASAKAARAANQASAALAQLMRGNVIGAYRSATAAVKGFYAAIVADPAIAVCIGIAAAVGAIALAWRNAEKKLEAYTATTKRLADVQATLKDLTTPKTTLGALSDSELETLRRRKSAELKDSIGAAESNRELSEYYANGALNGSLGDDITGLSGRRQQFAELYAKWAEGDAAAAKQAKEELAKIDAEISRREKAKSSKEQSRAAGETSLRHKQERDEAYDRAEAEKPGSGRLAALEKELSQVKEMHSIAEEGSEKELELRGKIYDIERSITEEKERQKKIAENEAKVQEEWRRGRKLDKMDAGERVTSIQQEIDALRQQKPTAENQARMRKLIDERDAAAKTVEGEKQTHAEWQRSRKLGKMGAEDRVSHINDEIAKLRQQPATIENRQRMRQLIEERDAAQEDADAFKEKKQDFLHRNDTDAQRMASIGKQLAEAGVKGDEAAMLELMMSGEEIAENYKEPLTKRQKRRADRKAERDAKAAMRAAKTLRKQMGEIEAAWAGGDKSAAEKVAGMTIDASGKVSSMQMSKDGKLVKVEGQDYTNTLLEQIKKALE